MRHPKNLILARFLPLVALFLSLSAILPAQQKPQGPVTETGEIEGAEFRIDIPKDWNGGLVMYAHGYETVAPTRRDFNMPMVEVAKRLNYAIAQSKYNTQGWAAREGILDNEALRRHFLVKYGKTYPTIIAGHSMGGAISFRTIELYPEVYDGALPMCGTAEPALKFFKERVFDMRLLFDYYFPGVAGSVVEFPDGEQTMTKAALKISALVKADPDKAKKFIQLVNLPNVESIAPVVGFWSEILREMTIRAGGNAFDNRETIYAGTEDDAKINREIKRYKSDPKAVEYVRQWTTPTGKILDPVLAMHTLVDQLVPAQSAAYYNQLTQTTGTGDLYVQLYVDRVGHCAFNADEMTEGLRRLDDWIRNGKKPEGGDVTKKSASGDSKAK